MVVMVVLFGSVYASNNVMAFDPQAAMDKLSGIQDKVDNEKKALITTIIEEYQLAEPNPTNLTNGEITEKIWEWYTAPLYVGQHAPEISKETLIQKYLDIIEHDPGPTIEERIDSIFNR